MHEYKGRIFIGSGWESAEAKNNPFIQYYDVAEDKWFVATRLEFKNHALGYGSMFLYDNKLYYIGGYSNEAEPNFNNLIRSFDLEKLQFEEIDYQRQLIDNLDETKLSKSLTSLVAETELSLSDVFVIDKGSGARKITLSILAGYLATGVCGVIYDC